MNIIPFFPFIQLFYSLYHLTITFLRKKSQNIVKRETFVGEKFFHFEKF